MIATMKFTLKRTMTPSNHIHISCLTLAAGLSLSVGSPCQGIATPAPPNSELAHAVTSAEAPPGEVTFTEHVASIIFNNCTSCHRPGEGAPFSLRNFREVRKRARMIAKVTKKRFMPPWHPVQGHGKFKGERRLSDQQIATIRDWVSTGMKEGDTTKLPPMPNFVEGWQLGQPDLVVKMPKAFPVPAGGPDIYRNFVIPLTLEEDKWITAIEVRPGDRAVLHHTIFGFDSSGAARRADGRDGRPGYSGMSGGGGSRVGVSTSGLGGWAVGGQPSHLPLGMARKLPKGADIVLRSHLHPAGKKTHEQTTLGLYFTDKPPTRTMVGLQLPPRFGIGAGLDIPPGDKNFKIGDSFTLPVDVQALTVGGHAHYLCREMRVTVTPPNGGQPRLIFFIDDWAFNWQNRYQYQRPVSLRRGTKIDVEIIYDNSADNPSNPFDPPRRVRWGLQSTDEMGSITLLMVAKREQDTRRLKRAIRDAARASMRGKGIGAGLAGMLISRVKMMDKNGDGKIQTTEIPSRWKRYFERLDKNSDGIVDEKELEALDLSRRR